MGSIPVDAVQHARMMNSSFKLKASLLCALVLFCLLVPWMLQHRSQQTLREENAALRQQLAQLQKDTLSLSNRVALATKSPSWNSDRLRELLRLRGQVGVLRSQNRELERAITSARGATPDRSAQSASEVGPPPVAPAPFQLQLVLDEPGEDSDRLTNNASGGGAEVLQVQRAPLMDYTAISSVTVTRNGSTGVPEIAIEFSEVGKELFAAVTRENLNKRLAIVLDGQSYAAPVIREEITGGRAQITGNFSEEEARILAAKISDAMKPK